MMYSRRGYPRVPDLRPIGTPIPDSRPNRETGDFPIPDFGRIGTRGFPPPIPGQIGNRGNGNWGFPGLHGSAQTRIRVGDTGDEISVPQWMRSAAGPALNGQPQAASGHCRRCPIAKQACVSDN